MCRSQRRKEKVSVSVAHPRPCANHVNSQAYVNPLYIQESPYIYIQSLLRDWHSVLSALFNGSCGYSNFIPTTKAFIKCLFWQNIYKIFTIWMKWKSTSCATLNIHTHAFSWNWLAKSCPFDPYLPHYHNHYVIMTLLKVINYLIFYLTSPKFGKFN